MITYTPRTTISPVSATACLTSSERYSTRSTLAAPAAWPTPAPRGMTTGAGGRAQHLSEVSRSLQGMEDTREQAVLRAAMEIWDTTGDPVSAADIAQAVGFDDGTTQQALSALDSKGHFADALRGDDRIDCVAFAD